MALKILCVGSYAPYLGGSLTWAPLRRIAGASAEFCVLDPMKVVGSAQPLALFRKMVDEQIADAEIVIAHGFSAAITLRAAATHPENSRRLALLNPVLGAERRGNPLAFVFKLLVRGPAGALVLRRIAATKIARLKADPNVVRAELRRLLATEPDEELVQQAVERVVACDDGALLDSTMALVNADFSMGAVPSDHIDVISGTRGFTSRTMRRRVRRLLPDSARYELADCGEAPMYERPESVYDIVVRGMTCTTARSA